MSQEIEQEELYVEHEEFGEGLVLSIDEETDVAEIQFEHGVESIDINDLLESVEEDEDLEFDEEEDDEEVEELEEGRGKRGQARQASKSDNEDEFGYEKRGSKPAKGKFNYARQKKQSQYNESADLVGLALEKKPVDFTNKLNDILQARLQDRLADRKVEIAQNMYNSSDDGDDQDA